MKFPAFYFPEFLVAAKPEGPAAMAWARKQQQEKRR